MRAAFASGGKGEGPSVIVLVAGASAALLEFLKERGVDYATGDAQDAAADKTTLRWMNRQTDDRKPA